MGMDLTETAVPGATPLMTFRSGSAAAARALGPRGESWSGRGGAEPAAAPQSPHGGLHRVPATTTTRPATESSAPGARLLSPVRTRGAGGPAAQVSREVKM